MTCSSLIPALMGAFLAMTSLSGASQPLLDKLTASENEMEAARHEDDVWDAWLSESGPTVDIMMERAVDAMERGDKQVARDLFDRIILIDDTYAEVWHRRATLFYAQGQYDEAIADLEEALQREPRHFGAWTGLGLIFEAIAQREAALKAYREALKVHPYAGAARQGVTRLTPLVEGRSL